jgi:phosphomannomutase
VDLARSGIVYGFEEALGYLVNPETVRDKDGSRPRSRCSE